MLMILLLILSLLALSAEAWLGLGTSRRLLTSTVSSCFKMMSTPSYINMPALSSTMTEGKIVSWSKKIGDKVNAGDVLLVVESDKADMDVEAFEDGYLAAIYTPEGGSAAVGSAVAALVATKEAIGTVSGAPTTPTATISTPVASVPVPAPATTAATNKVGEAINMPALSSTMKEGKIVSWSKKVGDKVSSGDVLLVVESDKADMDVESYEDGFLAAVITGDGEIAQVGAPVAFIAKSKDEIPAVQAYANAVKSGGVAPIAVAAAVAAPVAATTASPAAAAPAPAIIVNNGRVVASGYAKSIAKSQGIDLKTVSASRSCLLYTSDAADE